MTHRRAVILMILATLMWSIAGVVTRHLDVVRSFEVSFWRSLFNALALVAGLAWLRGPALWATLRHGGWPLWASGVCWAGMFTAFMLALTLTTVANVLVTMAVGPLIAAIFSRVILGHRLPTRTWVAIGVAGAGIAWMYGREALAGASPTGTLVALFVPLAASSNWTILQHVAQTSGRRNDDMLPAVLIGAVLSALVTLPAALPLQSSTHDIGLLALLGVVQLAIPCLLVVRISRELPAAEISLLALLEVIFGVTWAWLGAGEEPSPGALVGGALVLGALVANETLAMAGARRRLPDDRRPA